MPSASAVRAGRAYVELYAKTSELHRQFKTELSRVATFAQEAARVSRITVTLSFVAAYPISRLVKDFSDFDDKLKIVQATTRATGKEFQELTDLTRQLGRETSFTAHEVASGMVQLGRAGFKPQEIEDTLKHFLNLSRATATELPRAVDIATATLRGFNMAASEAQDIADVLTATANSSAQTLDDLGDSFKYIIPLANTASLSLKDAAKATAMLANLGIKGTMAATGMRNILLRMSLPNIQDIYRNELGVEVVDQETGALRTFGDVMNDVAKSIKNISGAKRLAIFRDLFGLYGLASGAALSSGVDFSDMFDRIDNSFGEAQRVADKMDSGIGGSLRLTISKIRDISFAIGDAISPQLKKIAQDVSDASIQIIKSINNNKQVFDDIIDVCMNFASALSLVAKATLALVNIPGFKQFLKQLIGIAPIVFAVSKAFNVLSGTVSAVSKAFVGVTNGVFKLLYIKDHIKTIKKNLADLKQEFLLYLDSMTGSQKLHRVIAAMDKITAKQNRLKTELGSLWKSYNSIQDQQKDAYAKVKESIQKIKDAANDKNFAMQGLQNAKKALADFPNWLKQHQDAVSKATAEVAKWTNVNNQARASLAKVQAQLAHFNNLKMQGYGVPQVIAQKLKADQKSLAGQIAVSTREINKWNASLAQNTAIVSSAQSVRQGLINNVGMWTQRVGEATVAGNKAVQEYKKSNSVFASLSNALWATDMRITNVCKKITNLDFLMNRLEKTHKKVVNSLSKAFLSATLISGGVAVFLGIAAAIVTAIEKANAFKKALENVAKASERIKGEIELVDKQTQAGKDQFERLREINKEMEDRKSKGIEYNELMDEAKNIVASLTDNYGDLSLSIDEAVAKVENLIAAEKKYDMIMAQRKADKLKEDAANDEKHASALQEKVDNMLEAQERKRNLLRDIEVGRGTITAEEAEKAIPEFKNGERVFYSLRTGQVSESLAEEYKSLVSEIEKLKYDAEQKRKEASELVSGTKKAVEEQNDPTQAAIFRAEGFEEELNNLSKELLGDSKSKAEKNVKDLISQLDEKVQGVFINRIDALDLLNDKDFLGSGEADKLNSIREGKNYKEAVDYFQKLSESFPNNEKIKSALTVAQNALSKAGELEAMGAYDEFKNGLNDTIKKSLISAEEEVRQKLESAGETVNKSKVDNLSTLDSDVKDYRNAEINYYKEQYNRAKELRNQLVQYASSVKTAQESVGPEFENVRTMYQELADTIADAIEKARSTEEEAADKIESNREALKKDLEDTGKIVKDDIERTFGTFNGIEAIDALYGGNNSLMEYEKKKTRFLDSLDRTLQKFFSAYSNYDGEYV